MTRIIVKKLLKDFPGNNKLKDRDYKVRYFKSFDNLTIKELVTKIGAKYNFPYFFVFIILKNKTKKIEAKAKFTDYKLIRFDYIELNPNIEPKKPKLSLSKRIKKLIGFNRIMKIKKEFEGKLTEYGDDPFCFGVHQGFKDDNSTPNEGSPVIDFLDEIAEKFKDKKATIKVIVEIKE